MISAVSISISTYKPAQRAAMPVVIQLDAAMSAAKNKEMARNDAKAKALTDERQKFLQIQYVGPARAAARLTALGQSLPKSCNRNMSAQLVPWPA